MSESCSTVPWVAPLLKWYRQNKRDLPWRHTKDPYRIWISEIMLQQTRVAAVISYYHRFLEALPDVQSLAAVSEDKLMQLWAGLGYYSRARNLKAAAVQICERGGTFPATYEELLQLPGIGPYTAGAIGSIAFGLPVACVDGNVLRVLSRLQNNSRNICDDKVKAAQKQSVEALLKSMSSDNIVAFNQALMELGAIVCVPNGPPLCEQCPACFCCQAKQAGTAELLPVKSPKKPRRTEDKTVYLICCDNTIALQKRPAKGLLAGLWEFPNEKGLLSSKDATAFVRSMGLEPLRVQLSGEKKHIFTHVEWQMRFYEVWVSQAAPVPQVTWAQQAHLQEQFGLPAAFLPPKP